MRSMSVPIEPNAAFPNMDYESWRDTLQTIHRFAQVVGKLRLAASPAHNHWWNASSTTPTSSPSRAQATSSRTTKSRRCLPREPRTRHTKHTNRGLIFEEQN